MSEAFSWMEGSAYFYTGTATASAIVAYAQDSNAVLTYGWDNRRLVTGTYINVLTGQRADVTIRAAYTPDRTIQQFAHQTALTNLHLKHLHAGGSAGVLFYSGRIDRIDLVGSESYPYVYGITYHANAWSAY
jgi:hypothetical protein